MTLPSLTRREFLNLAGSGFVCLSLNGCSARSLPIRTDALINTPESLPFSGLISSLSEEYDYEADVEGTLPKELRGTLYRNGAGIVERKGLRKRALMDADGMVHAYHFHDHGVRFRNRHVMTEKFREESAAGEYLYPTFSTQAPGGVLANFWPGSRIKSQAQISVAVWNNRLYAFDESSYPYELDPDTLATIGVSHLGLPEGLSIFSAHSKIDMQNREWILFGLHYGRRVTLHTTIVDAQGKLKNHRALELPRYVYMHDFFATERHLIFILHPLEFHIFDFLLGMSSMFDSLRWKPEKGNLVLIMDKTGTGDPFFIETEPCFMWHSLNAYEEKGKIIADFAGYSTPDHFIGPDAPVFSVMKWKKGSYTGLGVLRRYAIDPGARTLVHRVLLDDNHEWPMVNPFHRCRAYRYGYLARAQKDEFFWSGITRIDTLTGRTEDHDFGSNCYCGEPVFVPRPGMIYSAESSHEPGWIMTEIYDSSDKKSFLAIFDSERIAEGPVGRILLRHHMPYSMHGFWQNNIM